MTVWDKSLTTDRGYKLLSKKLHLPLVHRSLDPLLYSRTLFLQLAPSPLALPLQCALSFPPLYEIVPISVQWLKCKKSPKTKTPPHRFSIAHFHSTATVIFKHKIRSCQFLASSCLKLIPKPSPYFYVKWPQLPLWFGFLLLSWVLVLFHCVDWPPCWASHLPSTDPLLGPRSFHFFSLEIFSPSIR